MVSPTISPRLSPSSDLRRPPKRGIILHGRFLWTIQGVVLGLLVGGSFFSSVLVSNTKEYGSGMAVRQLQEDMHRPNSRFRCSSQVHSLRSSTRNAAVDDASRPIKNNDELWVAKSHDSMTCGATRESGKAEGSSPIISDTFPAMFDQQVYARSVMSATDAETRRSSFQLATDPVAALEHYETVGRKLGLLASPGQEETFLSTTLNEQIVPQILQVGPILEMIGPSSPDDKQEAMIRRSSTEQQQEIPLLTKKTDRLIQSFSVTKQGVTANAHDSALLGELSAVAPPPTDRIFAMVASSRIVELDHDLVGHLQAVSRLLSNEGGVYFLLVSDKRYDVDHFMPETSLSRIMADYVRHPCSESTADAEDNCRQAEQLENALESLEQQSLATHNDAARHWKSDHASTAAASMEQQQPSSSIVRVQSLWKQWQDQAANSTTGENTPSYDPNVHHYHFTPHGLAMIVDALFDMNLIDMHVERLFETVHNDNKFGLVLRKCESPKVV